jgi:hypothetical protein
MANGKTTIEWRFHWPENTPGVLRSYKDIVQGQHNRVDENTAPPDGFTRDWYDTDDSDMPDDGFPSYYYRRGEQYFYQGRIYTKRKQQEQATRGVLFYVQELKPGYLACPYSDDYCRRLYEIEEVLSCSLYQHSRHERHNVTVFRVDHCWYLERDFVAYLDGEKSSTWSTAQEAVDAHTKECWPSWKKDIRYKDIPPGAGHVDEVRGRIHRHGWGVRFESASAVAKRKAKEDAERKKAAQLAEEAERLAAEKKARRDAEDAEIAALEADLADLERQEKLKQLRAKVAQMKEE